MHFASRRTDLPVLLLHNVDRNWDPAEKAQALRMATELEAAMRQEGHPVTNLPVTDGDLARCLRGHDPQACIVLNWCEDLPGVPHSDALVAQMLERLRFAYTGSSPEVLALSWDKPRVKLLLEEWGVATPAWRLCESPRVDGWVCFPAIVKPAREHCSYGVSPESVVLNPAQLRARVAYVLEVLQQPALVEDFIDGREFHVSVWGNGAVQMLPPVEMDFAALDDVRDRVCSYDSKFCPASRHYEEIEMRLPAPLTAAERASLEQAVLKTYRALGCRDYARLDIRLRDGVFYVLDVNPNPDIGAEASMAYAAAAAGYSYGAMASQLVSLAALRHPVFGAGRH